MKDFDSSLARPDSKKPDLRTGKLFSRATAFLGLLALLLATNLGFGEESSATKHQVEAVFLFNFAKYVDWPVTAFPSTNAPVTIGVLGKDPFGDNLERLIDGKTVNGHPFVIKHLAAGSDLSGCHILFISDSETSRMGEILDRAGALPILTVGEGEEFARKNGVINFILTDEKVRLAINLTAARKAGLVISSRLLAVADVVKGRAN